MIHVGIMKETIIKHCLNSIVQKNSGSVSGHTLFDFLKLLLDRLNIF